LISGSGFGVTSDGNEIRGLILRGFKDNGITVTGGAVHNRFSSNVLYRNKGLGIDLGDDGITPNDLDDLDTGPNDLLNFPVFDSVREVGTDTFTVYGTAPANALVELYIATEAGHGIFVPEPLTHGPAYQLLDTATAAADGSFIIDTILKPEWSSVTATATDASGNTSEFSENLVLIPEPIRVTAYSDQVEIRVWYTPTGATSPVDSIGPALNTFNARATYSTDTDYNGDMILDTRVVILTPEPGVYRIVMTYTGPGAFVCASGIGIDGHEATTEIQFAFSGDTYETSLEHAPPVSNRGDLDRDGFITALDLAIEIDILFAGRPLPEPPGLSDLDCDGFPTALDLAYIIDYLFAGGPMPCLK
jgi:hypothetical protein